MYLLPGIFGSLLPLLVIGAIVYLLVRRRNGKEGVTAFQALMAYFYTIISASIITASIGMGHLLFAAFNAAYGGRGIAGDLTLGLTLLITGLGICVLHVYGKRILEQKHGKTTPVLKRVYLFFMLAIFSISGLIALPLAIYGIAHYYVGGSIYWDNPSAQLATALVVVPLWIYYFLRVMRDTRINREETHDSAQEA